MKTERKEIRLEKELLERMEKRATRLGINLTAYIHFCIAKDLTEAKEDNRAN